MSTTKNTVIIPHFPKGQKMESVYFGKENDIKIFPDKIDTAKQEKEKEYYFPDENNRKFKVAGFFSALFVSSILDLIILSILTPYLVFFLQDVIPELRFIEFTVFAIAYIVLFYTLVFLIIDLPIRFAGRKKVYVNDNGTFYIIKKCVKVNTHKKGLFTSVENANKKIHSKYAKQINKINNLIDKKSFAIRKVLTDCKLSDEIHENGLYFTGYNEVKLCDEDFRIPQSYIKYDPNAEYYSKNALWKTLFYFIKIALYAGVFLFLFSIIFKKYSIYEANIISYIAEKSAQVEPYGFEYYVSQYGDFGRYEYIEFKTDDELQNTIRFYYSFTRDGRLTDDNIYISLDMYTDSDIDFLEPLIRDIYQEEAFDTAMIYNLINEYKDNPGTNISDVKSTNKTYLSVSVTHSYRADYNVYIYINDFNYEYTYY